MKVETPLLVPVLAALPVCACMAILGLRAYEDTDVIAFRTVFIVACMIWLIPLTLLQRAMWCREWSWVRMVPILLVITYAMAIVNALLGQSLGIWPGRGTGYHFADLARGLDSCWLPLISFCAVHAVAAYYMSLQQVRLHLVQAQSAARSCTRCAYRSIRITVPELSVSSITTQTPVDRKALLRLLDRCMATHPDGIVYGFRGAVPSLHVKPYERYEPVKFGRTAGKAGAFQKLLQR